MGSKEVKEWQKQDDERIMETIQPSIDDKIDEWHKSDSKQTLAEYLGMTPEQYAAYVEGRVVKLGPSYSKDGIYLGERYILKQEE